MSRAVKLARSEQATDDVAAYFVAALSQPPNKSQIMLAYTRNEVRQLNEQARAMRHAQGELGKDHTLELDFLPRWLKAHHTQLTKSSKVTIIAMTF